MQEFFFSLFFYFHLNFEKHKYFFYVRKLQTIATGKFSQRRELGPIQFANLTPVEPGPVGAQSA